MRKLLQIFMVATISMTTLAPTMTQPTFAATQSSRLGDLTPMRLIIADTLSLVKAGDIKGAIKRITEFETVWDKNASRLKRLDAKTWKKLDGASDVALSTVRYPSATQQEMKKDISDLLSLLDNPN